MKKILFCVYTFIALTLFSQPALAEDATYDTGTGTLTIPDVIGDGTTCWNNVIMLRGTGWDFTVTGATSQTCGSDTSGFTTYNSATGIVFIPSVVVRRSGARTICYYVDMAKDISGFTVTGIGVQAWCAATTSPVPDTSQTYSCTDTFGEDSDYNTLNQPSYTDNGDGTVTDNVTGVIWQQTDDGIGRTWSGAISYCDLLNLGNAETIQWYVPTVMQLTLIIHYDLFGPSLSRLYYPNAKSAAYWTSSTNAANPSDSAWYVNFYNGVVGYANKLNNNYVRCVSSGQ